MLERVCGATLDRSDTRPKPNTYNIPVWSIDKALWFLDKVYASLQKSVLPTVKVFSGAFIKFEPFDRSNRPVYKEFADWPLLNLPTNEANSSYMPNKKGKAKKRTTSKSATSISSQTTSVVNKPKPQGDQNHNNRMTRKAKQRREKNIQETKQSGYCEICRIDYLSLSEHEKSLSHVNFSRNGANFLSLDSLIGASADVQAFLKLNKSGMVCEKKTLRNMLKIHQDSEDNKKELQVLCNGGSDHIIRHISPRDNCKRNSIERTIKLQISPALSADGGHYLRSKGASVEVSPKDLGKKENLQNGDTSPRNVNFKNDSESLKKINGKIDDSNGNNASKGKNPRSIRWRRPSPESTPQPTDTRPYYKVVGMTTKLRSSGNFQIAQQKEDSITSNQTICNGDAPLVVKFKRIRRSELSVLSDEAENFMFPKKDDDESSETEDEVETSKSNDKCVSSEVLSTESPRSTRVKRLKDVIISDEDTRDSSGSEFTMTPRKSKIRRTKKQNMTSGQRRPYRTQSRSKSPIITKRKKTETKTTLIEEPKVIHTDPNQIQEPTMILIDPKLKQEPKERCCKWEDGRLKFSPKVDNLKFSFERVPENGSWYDAFIGQYHKFDLKDVGRYFHAYRKQKVLPFQKINLPPLKPGCCKLNEVQKKVMEPRSAPVAGPSRIYGTRGMKKKRHKIFLSDGRPRKSPREHASTLAILGGLVHKGKKLSSDELKSLPPLPEEDSSSDATIQQKEHFEVKESAKEVSKKLDDFLSSVYDDVAEYDVPFENVDNDVRIDTKSSKPDILDLIASYENDNVLDETVKQLQENITEGKPKYRKGFKTKKKNRTGWPKKKKIPKKETDERSTAEESCSHDEDTVADEQGDIDIEVDENAMDVPAKMEIVSANKRVKSSLSVSLRINDISIMSSISDLNNKKKNNLKRDYTDGEFSNSEDDTLSAEQELSDRISEENSSDEKPLEELQRKSRQMYQPIVRVQKMDDLFPPGRRLRSATVDRSPRSRRSPRKLRPSKGHWYANR